MEKVYIVTAKSAEDAVRKVKAARANDGPMFEPTESNFEKFIKEAKRVIAEVKLDELETKFNDVQNAIQFKIVQLLDDSCTTGNIWWDFKKLLEQDKEGADLELVKKKYAEFIDLFEKFKDEYAKKGEALSDATNQKTVKNSWVPWFEKAIKRARDNLEACMKDAEDKKAKLEEKASAPKVYNKVK